MLPWKKGAGGGGGEFSITLLFATPSRWNAALLYKNPVKPGDKVASSSFEALRRLPCAWRRTYESPKTCGSSVLGSKTDSSCSHCVPQ